jgi:hypothetical protein
MVTREMIKAGMDVFSAWGVDAASSDYFLGLILTEAFEAMEAVRQSQLSEAIRRVRTDQVSKGHLSPNESVS